MCLVDDAEQCEFFQEREYRARKEHHCNECYRVIKKGESYRRIVSVMYGEFSQEKMCEHCMVCASWLTFHCRGYVGGMIRDDIREHWEWDHDREVGRLLIGMRKKWIKRNGKMMKLPTFNKDKVVA
jgi:hypothetical protein